MKHLIYLACICSYLSCYAQNEVKLVGFTPSQCDGDKNASEVQSRIVSQNYKDGIFEIEVGFQSPCCSEFNPVIEYKNDTLFLDYELGMELCECTCCYQLIYQIEGLEDKQFAVKLRGEKISLSEHKYHVYPIRYEVCNGDTVNYFDIYSFPQGWHLQGDCLNPRWKAFYKDGKKSKRVSMNYYENGNIKSERTSNMINGDFVNIKLEYYLNGKVKSECITDRVDFQSTTSNPYYFSLCSEWDSLGNPTKTIDECLLNNSPDQLTVISLYKRDSVIYINHQRKVEIADLEKFEGIMSQISFCYEIGADMDLVNQVMAILKQNDSRVVSLHEFEVKR